MLQNNFRIDTLQVAMKTAKDPRHLQRIKLVQNIFAWDFNHKQPEDPEVQEILEGIEEKHTEIDNLIGKAAPAWPLEKINKIDLAILRVATYELLFPKDEESRTPPKVAVDEAVEIAKEFGADSSPSFVNGVLGKLIEDQQVPA